MRTGTSDQIELSDPIARILEARHHDPFEVLGRHDVKDRCVVRAFLPQAEKVSKAFRPLIDQGYTVLTLTASCGLISFSATRSVAITTAA